MAEKACMRCYISGKVQGVWFRASAKEQAEKLEIKGWARNLPDGRVEVFACGIKDQLNAFYDWLGEGPDMADVKHLTREDLSWEECSGFEVK